jgi:hypothetical protein
MPSPRPSEIISVWDNDSTTHQEVKAYSDVLSKEPWLFLDRSSNNKKKGRSGHKRKDLGLLRIPTIPLNKRSTMRALALSLNVAFTTLQKRFKWGEIRWYTSSLKPYLKPNKKIDRFKFTIKWYAYLRWNTKETPTTGTKMFFLVLSLTELVSGDHHTTTWILCASVGNQSSVLEP